MLAGDAGYRPAILDDHGAVLEGRQSDAFASLVGVLSAASLTRAHSPTGCEWVCIPLTIARAGVLRSSPLKKRITLADTPELLRSPGLARRDSGIEGHRGASTIASSDDRGDLKSSRQTRQAAERCRSGKHLENGITHVGTRDRMVETVRVGFGRARRHITFLKAKT